MIDWDKYLIHGSFILHSGLKSDHKWEFDFLRDNPEDMKLIQLAIKCLLYPDLHVIGIRTMGWEVVETLPNSHEYPLIESFDRPLYYCIFDDVITTGSSIMEVMNEMIHSPVKIICIVNRSKLRFINGVRIYEIKNMLEVPKK